MNRAAIDRYTLAHFASGLLAGASGVPFERSMRWAIGYEAVEQVVERTDVGRRIFGSDGPESLPNVAMDLLVFAAGHWVARSR